MTTSSSFFFLRRRWFTYVEVPHLAAAEVADVADVKPVAVFMPGAILAVRSVMKSPPSSLPLERMEMASLDVAIHHAVLLVA